jgi:diaminopimelate epimerase
MKVETGGGVLCLELQLEGGEVRSVTVNMGQPMLEMAKIPVESRFLKASSKSNEYSFSVEGSNISDAAFVSMGNPHVVIFVDDVSQIDVARLGPLVERHQAFPRRINAHWVQVKSRSEVIVRTWERGSGITLACGTGACAVCVAGSLTGRTDRKILAHLPGGDLSLEWRQKDNCVYMTGPAVEVFSGEWDKDD